MSSAAPASSDSDSTSPNHTTKKDAKSNSADETKSKAMSRSKRSGLAIKVSACKNLLTDAKLRQAKYLDVACAAVLQRILSEFLVKLAEFMAYAHNGHTKVTHSILYECLGKTEHSFSKFINTSKLVVVGGSRIASSAFRASTDDAPSWTDAAPSHTPPLVLGDLAKKLNKTEKKTKKLTAAIDKDAKKPLSADTDILFAALGEALKAKAKKRRSKAKSKSKGITKSSTNAAKRKSKKQDDDATESNGKPTKSTKSKKESEVNEKVATESKGTGGKKRKRSDSSTEESEGGKRFSAKTDNELKHKSKKVKS
jgi:hypothetical protein